MNATTIVVKEQNQGDTTLDSKNLQESAQSFKKRILLSFVFIFLILASLLSLPTKKQKSTAVEKSTKFEFSLEFPTKGIVPDGVIDPTPVNKQFTQQFAAQIAGTSGYSNNA